MYNNSETKAKQNEKNKTTLLYNNLVFTPLFLEDCKKGGNTASKATSVAQCRQVNVGKLKKPFSTT